MKRFLCWLRGHALTLEMMHKVGGPLGMTLSPWRLRCTRCGVCDPWSTN